MISMSIPINRDFVITDTYTNDNRREFYIENNSDSLWKQEKDLKILITTRTIQVINAMIAPNGRISIKKNVPKVFKSSEHKFVLNMLGEIAFNPYNYGLMASCLGALSVKMTDQKRTVNNKLMIRNLLKTLKGYYSYMKPIKYSFWGKKSNSMINFTEQYQNTATLNELKSALYRLKNINNINVSGYVDKFLMNPLKPENYEYIVDILISLNNIENNTAYINYINNITVLLEYLNNAVWNYRYTIFGEPMYGQFMIDLGEEYKKYLESDASIPLTIPKLGTDDERKRKLDKCVHVFVTAFDKYQTAIRAKKNEFSNLYNACGSEMQSLMDSFGGAEDTVVTANTEEEYKEYLKRSVNNVIAIYKKTNELIGEKVDTEHAKVVRKTLNVISKVADIIGSDYLPDKAAGKLKLASELINKGLDAVKVELGDDAYSLIKAYNKNISVTDKEIMMYFCNEKFIDSKILCKVKSSDINIKLSQLPIFQMRDVIGLLANIRVYNNVGIKSDPDIYSIRNGERKFILNWISAFRVLGYTINYATVRSDRDYNIIFWHVLEDIAGLTIPRTDGDKERDYYKEVRNICNTNYGVGFLTKKQCVLQVLNYIILK